MSKIRNIKLSTGLNFEFRSQGGPYEQYTIRTYGDVEEQLNHINSVIYHIIFVISLMGGRLEHLNHIICADFKFRAAIDRPYDHIMEQLNRII